MRNGVTCMITLALIYIVNSMVYAADKVIVVPLNHESNSIIGSWWLNETPEADNIVTITFLDSTHYILSECGDSSTSGDPNGTDGIEHGTYTWNPTTGAFAVSVTRDDNGEWGFSHNQDPTTITISGNTMTFTDQSSTVQLYRVTE